MPVFQRTSSCPRKLHKPGVRKLLLTGDWHVDWVTAGVARLPDLQQAVKATIRSAIEAKCTDYVFLGDLANPEGVNEATCLIIEAVWTLVQHDIDVHLIPGNHDVVENGAGTTTLSPLAVAAMAINQFARRGENPDIGEVIVCERPKLYEIGPYNWLALPYTPHSHTYDPEAFVREHKKQLAQKPTIAYGHLMFDGITPGVETTDMPRGRDILFPLDELKRRCKGGLFMANGHYHERQVYSGVQIPGSLERLTFGEEHNTPGWLIVEV